MAKLRQIFCAYRLWPWFSSLASTYHGLHAQETKSAIYS